ncbi:unnamed protein product, partial [Nesidiocoris tenuis]
MLPPTPGLDDVTYPSLDSIPVFNTCAAEVMRQHLGDALDFLADIHTITKLKMAADKLKVSGNVTDRGDVEISTRCAGVWSLHSNFLKVKSHARRCTPTVFNCSRTRARMESPRVAVEQCGTRETQYRK